MCVMSKQFLLVGLGAGIGLLSFYIYGMNVLKNISLVSPTTAPSSNPNIELIKIKPITNDPFVPSVPARIETMALTGKRVRSSFSSSFYM